jgi:hypothetical protein
LKKYRKGRGVPGVKGINTSGRNFEKFNTSGRGREIDTCDPIQSVPQRYKSQAVAVLSFPTRKHHSLTVQCDVYKMEVIALQCSAMCTKWRS